MPFHVSWFKLSGPVLRDTARLSQRYPPIARCGVLVSQHGQLGAIPPPAFLSISRLESMRSGGAIHPPQKGYLSDTCAIPLVKTRQTRAIPPVRYYLSGLEKGVFWKRGLFRKVHLLEILENSEIPEILENPQTVENKEESDHFLEILDNLEILEILEISPVKRPLS